MLRFVDPKPWAPVIGNYMISYGSIENSINELLRNVCSEAVMGFVVTLQLGQRIKLLREGLPDWKALSEDNKKVILLTLDEIEHLAKTRNLIAHNPLLLSLFEEDGSERTKTREHIRSAQSGKTVTLQELTQLSERAMLVAKALEQNWLEYDVSVMGDQPQPTFKRP
jgi:hypothetical protein